MGRRYFIFVVLPLFPNISKEEEVECGVKECSGGKKGRGKKILYKLLGEDRWIEV